MRLTALPPPPPRPITLILAAWGASSTSNSGRRARSFSIESSSIASAEGAPVFRRGAPRVAVPSGGSPGGSECPRRDRSSLEDFTEESGQPTVQPTEEGAVVRLRGRQIGRAHV